MSFLRQQNARSLAAVWATCLGLLVLPGPWLSAVGFLELREFLRPWLVSGSAVAFLVWLAAFLVQAGDWWHLRGVLSQHIRMLSDPERIVLFYCLQQDQRTVWLPPSSGTAAALCEKQLLRPAGTGSMTSWPYVVPDAVWEYLHRRRRDWLAELQARPDLADQVVLMTRQQRRADERYSA